MRKEPSSDHKNEPDKENEGSNDAARETTSLCVRRGAATFGGRMVMMMTVIVMVMQRMMVMIYHHNHDGHVKSFCLRARAASFHRLWGFGVKIFMWHCLQMIIL